jgi:hypothetical protein
VIKPKTDMLNLYDYPIKAWQETHLLVKNSKNKGVMVMIVIKVK